MGLALLWVPSVGTIAEKHPADNGHFPPAIDKNSLQPQFEQPFLKKLPHFLQLEDVIFVVNFSKNKNKP
jgi:hypothetical protein